MKYVLRMRMMRKRNFLVGAPQGNIYRSREILQRILEKYSVQYDLHWNDSGYSLQQYLTCILSRVCVWLYTGFGLIIGFIGPFNTARDYTLQFTHTHIHTHTLVSTVPSSLAVARWRLPLCSRIISGLSYQLLTATAHKNSTRAVHLLIKLVTHQPSHSIVLKSTDWLNLLPTNCPACNISARTAHKTPFLWCCLRAVAW
jgi:hypothetical protein